MNVNPDQQSYRSVLITIVVNANATIELNKIIEMGSQRFAFEIRIQVSKVKSDFPFV